MAQSRNGLENRYHKTEAAKKSSVTQGSTENGGLLGSLGTEMQETIKLERERTGSNFSLQEIKDQSLMLVEHQSK